MSADLDSKILGWIYEEAPREGAEPVPMQLLMVRMAMLKQNDDHNNLTRSVELSLNEFDRASFYRSLRALLRKGFIRLINQDGSLPKETDVIEMSQRLEDSKLLGFIALTDPGRHEIYRIRMMNPDN